MNHLSLFSGIGGFDLAAEWAGFTNVAHCEYSEFCRKVLKHYWKNAESFTDIITTDFTKFEGAIDLLTGGFPCQPFSVAGLRKGTDDERYLWGQMLRAIREIRPRAVIAENVRGIISWSKGLVFEQVCVDLENEGYTVKPYNIPACGVDAPHRRERVWFVAHSVSDGHEHRGFSEDRRTAHPGESEENKWQRFRNVVSGDGATSTFTDTDSARLERWAEPRNVGKIGAGFIQLPTGFPRPNWENFPTESPVRGGNDGVPSGLAGITLPKHRNESLKAYGNAIVPQVAYQIMEALKDFGAFSD